jgi:hypothetical protein
LRIFRQLDLAIGRVREAKKQANLNVKETSEKEQAKCLPGGGEGVFVHVVPSESNAVQNTSSHGTTRSSLPLSCAVYTLSNRDTPASHAL